MFDKNNKFSLLYISDSDDELEKPIQKKVLIKRPPNNPHKCPFLEKKYLTKKYKNKYRNKYKKDFQKFENLKLIIKKQYKEINIL